LIKCVVFDFDLTLVDSSNIAHVIERGEWGAVFRNISDIPIYDNVKKALIELVKLNIPYAIASNAPRGYIEKVLKYHQIPCDFIVGYHDVSSHKPSSESLLKCSAFFGVSPENCVYIGNDNIDYETAVNAGFGFLGVEWGRFDGLQVKKFCYSNFITNLIGFVDNESIEELERDCIVNNSNHFCLGFYAGTIKSKVLDFKSGSKDSEERWAALIKRFSSYFPKVDIVVRALGHKELLTKENKLSALARVLAHSMNASYEPDLLTKSQATIKSSSLSKYQRIEQIKGLYSAKKNVISKYNLSFIIFDDVFTTGATTKEITRAIHDSYPNAKVFIVTLVKTLLSSESHLAVHHNRRLDKLYGVLKENSDLPHQTRKHKKITELFSANYSHTNHNFVIQNLSQNSISSESERSKYLPAIHVLKNILQRGKPTLVSRFLKEHLSMEKLREFNSADNALIDNKRLSWERIIKGDTVTSFNPAKKFYDELIDKYLGDLKFIRNLILPEARLFDITQVYVESLYNQFVDFYLPQASLIIEIDGSQHELDGGIDYIRDNHAQKYGITTLRITSSEISSESESFKQKMVWLVNYLNTEITNCAYSKFGPTSTITIKDYKDAYFSKKDYQAKNYFATAILRFQLTLLELLENGTLSFNNNWAFEIKSRDTTDFCELAIEDLSLWLSHLLTLQNVNFKPIEYSVTYIKESDEFTNNHCIKIDFSLFQRYTDEHQLRPEVIYVRTHYLDEYKHFCNDHSGKIESVEYKAHDYFQLATSSPIEYRLQLDENSPHHLSLIFILENIFLYNLSGVSFREGQLGIIASALMRNDTIGLLPTGSGKSVCYQLAAILQPAISFVVCPIKSLMYDQKADLDTVFFSRTNFITSDLSAAEKENVQKDFSRGKYFFIYISPERFQSQAFRLELQKLNNFSTFAYAVIDEVHCLSEWGHDFRISYLNLANAIDKFAPDSTYIGLTATASVNVLRDIQSEFKINDVNVKTPINFTRKELRFDIIDDGGQKADVLKNLLLEMKDKWQKQDGSDRKCGIVFTPHVNGQKGCYPLAGSLSAHLGEEVHYYSGSTPKDFNSPIMSNSEFEKYKKDVQDGFKLNKYHLLTATKAFGMGVNKGNIAFTVHYGMPGSMEALYQEAGRAGRNKELFVEQPADCLVLVSPEHYTGLDEVWTPTVSVEQLRKHQKNLSRDSDISTNLFMFLNGIDTVKDDFSLIKRVYDTYYQEGEELLKRVQSLHVNADKSKVQKAIYRLLQLGIVSDWTVEDYFRGVYEVQFVKHDSDIVRKTLESTIQKYEPDFLISNVLASPNGKYQTLVKMKRGNKLSDIEFYITILLLWSYEHFAYNRRQSLKNVYEQCLSLTTGEISNQEFKVRLENYFRFNQSSHFLQHIADNPHEFARWFNVFYRDNNSKDCNDLLSLSELSEIKDQLSRFLESYMNNTGLNFISGIVRLLLNDFNDPDGKNRLISAFRNINEYQESDIYLVIDGLIEIVSGRLTSKDKSELVITIHKVLDDEKVIEKFYASIGDEFSTSILLEKQLETVKGVVNKMRSINWLMH